MDAETINILRTLLEEYSNKNNPVVTAAALTVIGMLFVSFIAAVSQWLITKRVVSEEHKRLLVRLNAETMTKHHEKWEANIMESVMGLLKATDPEINKQINSAVVTTHTLKIQLLLNTNDPNQNKLNRLVNELALTVNGWQGDDDITSVLKIHTQLLEAARLLIYRPMNHRLPNQ